MHLAALQFPFTDTLFQPVLPPYLIAFLLLTLIILTYFTTIRTPVPKPPTLRFRIFLWLLRSAAFTAIALFLLNPVKQITTETNSATSILPPINILIDHSQSMTTRDILPSQSANPSATTQPISRFQALQNILNPIFIKKLSTRATPSFYLLGSELLPIPENSLPTIKPDSPDSQLTRQIKSFLPPPSPTPPNTPHPVTSSNTTPTPILLLTDARDTTNHSLAELLPNIRATATPLYIIPLGSPRKQPDLAIRLSPDQSRIITGQQTTLRAVVTKTGATPDYAEIILKKNNRIINRRRINLSQPVTRINYDITPSPPHASPLYPPPTPDQTKIADYEITITPFPGEQNTTNNKRHAFIEINNEKIRILLLENEPYWDTRFLIRALRADPKIELTTIIGLNNRVQHINRYNSNNNADNTASAASPNQPEPLDPIGIGSGSPVEIPVPQSVEQLRRYDIIILGKGIERWFPPKSANALTQFIIRDGGALIFARGIPCNINTETGRRTLRILEKISPIKWGKDILRQGGRLTRTPNAKARQPFDFQPLGDTDLILSKLPGMIAQTSIQHEKSLSTIWLRDDNGTSLINKDTPPAAVAQQRFGNGQTLAILTHGLWQWALQPPDNQNSNQTFNLFWTRAVRFLVNQGEFLPGRSIALSLSRLAVSPGESLQITMQTRFIKDSDLTTIKLTVISPENHSTTLKLEPIPTNRNIRIANFTPNEEGVYRILLETPDLIPTRLERKFAAYDFNREKSDVSADQSALQTLARSPLVKLINPQNPDQILNQLKKWSQSTFLIEKSLPNWPTIYALLFVLLTLTAEWYQRRSARLL